MSLSDRLTVTESDRKLIYLDLYRDFKKHKSDPKYYYGSAPDGQKLYPDHWVSAELRQQKGVSMAYRDMDNIPSVPAFVLSAKQILQNINNNRVARQTVTGANREPLEARISIKRAADGFEPRSASEVKRIKREDTLFKEPSQSLATNAEPQSYKSRPVLSKLVNNRVVKPKKVSKRQAARRAAQIAIRQATRAAFEKVHNKLTTSEANIGKDRETLRVRWELDVNLQLQTVTDDLQILNECFTRAESAIRDATRMIEDRLL